MTAASPCDHEVRRDEREHWQERNEMRDRQGSDQTRRVRSGLPAKTDPDRKGTNHDAMLRNDNAFIWVTRRSGYGGSVSDTGGASGLRSA